jgi:hypothetical protein
MPAEIQRAFAQQGVSEIRDFFSALEFDELRAHVAQKALQGGFRSMDGDAQVRGSPCEYADPAAERLLRLKTQSLSDWLQLELVPTYSYLRVYRPGDRLPAHRDRAACEITVSASLAEAACWPLQILLPAGVSGYCPAPRGAVAFRGHELVHWRDTLTAQTEVAHVLFHYVQKEGPHGSWANDRRGPPSLTSERACW